MTASTVVVIVALPPEVEHFVVVIVALPPKVEHFVVVIVALPPEVEHFVVVCCRDGGSASRGRTLCCNVLINRLTQRSVSCLFCLSKSMCQVGLSVGLLLDARCLKLTGAPTITQRPLYRAIFGCRILADSVRGGCNV